MLRLKEKELWLSGWFSQGPHTNGRVEPCTDARRYKYLLLQHNCPKPRIFPLMQAVFRNYYPTWPFFSRVITCIPAAANGRDDLVPWGEGKF